MTCSIEGCTSLAHSKGWCSKHYQRNWHYGSPTAKAPKREKTPKVLTCSIEGCGPAPKITKGYCSVHYYRFKRYGDPHTVAQRSEEDPIVRFWSYVDKSAGPDSCWLWTGAMNGRKSKSQMYGSFHPTQAVKVRTHRYAYELHHNVTLTSAEPIHHTCGNTLCVQPKHLQKVTQQENTAEMLERTFYLRRIAELEARVAELEEQVAA
jgi:hypothetical protein